jgi:hypothetical protein
LKTEDPPRYRPEIRIWPESDVSAPDEEKKERIDYLAKSEK